MGITISKLSKMNSEERKKKYAEMRDKILKNKMALRKAAHILKDRHELEVQTVANYIYYLVSK